MSIRIYKTIANTGREGSDYMHFVTLLPTDKGCPMLQIRGNDGGARIDMTARDALRIADVLTEWAQTEAAK